MAAKLTTKRLRPIKRRGDRIYISASTLVKRHAARPRRSGIPALASVQLAQLIREIDLAETGVRMSKLNNHGRSMDDFAEAALLTVRSICKLVHAHCDTKLGTHTLAMLPKKSDRLVFTKAQAQQLGQAVSTIIHVILWDAFATGLNAGKKRAPKKWRAQWQQNQQRYRNLVSRLHQSAVNKDASLAAICLLELAAWAFTELPGVSADAGRASAYARAKVHTSSSHYGLSVSRLSRRVAMLSGAAALLCQRLLTPRIRESTSRLAENRSKLMREDIDLWRVDLSLDSISVGQTVSISGRVEEVQWQERPHKSVSIARVTHLANDLLVPHKSLRRQGVAPGSYIWCRGKLKDARDGQYVEVNQQGPTAYARDVWEDWLAVQARPFYDLYPGSIQMEWEFPEEGHFGSTLDFLTRVN